MAKPALSGFKDCSGIQYSTLKAGGTVTSGATNLGVDANGNTVLAPTDQSITTTLIVDIGNIPLNAYSFIATVNGAQVGQVVEASISCPLGFYPDEFEMEPMAAYGLVLAANSVLLTLTCTSPLIMTAGKKLLTFTVI